MNGEFINGDCMEGMKAFEDNHFDLAIVDPPYGIGHHNHNSFKGGKRTGKTNHSKFNDTVPNNDYFTQLFRISKNQIIWGGNYFNLPPSKGVIIWDKGQRGLSQSDGELAWSSQNNLRIWTRNRVELLIEGTIHPTQKPIALYKWLLKNYAKEGDLILDTHVGSASSLIACEDMGFKYVGYELDKDYYQAASKRLENHLAQLKIF